MPRSKSLPVTNTAQVSPNVTNQKYSNIENLSAKSASGGASTIKITVPKMPPMAEVTKQMPSASSPLPFLVNKYASSA